VEWGKMQGYMGRTHQLNLQYSLLGASAERVAASQSLGWEQLCQQVEWVHKEEQGDGDGAVWRCRQTGLVWQ
jgi:hypothetical protein